MWSLDQLRKASARAVREEALGRPDHRLPGYDSRRYQVRPGGAWGGGSDAIAAMPAPGGLPAARGRRPARRRVLAGHPSLVGRAPSRLTLLASRLLRGSVEKVPAATPLLRIRVSGQVYRLATRYRRALPAAHPRHPPRGRFSDRLGDGLVKMAARGTALPGCRVPERLLLAAGRQRAGSRSRKRPRPCRPSPATGVVSTVPDPLFGHCIGTPPPGSPSRPTTARGAGLVSRGDLATEGATGAARLIDRARRELAGCCPGWTSASRLADPRLDRASPGSRPCCGRTGLSSAAGRVDNALAPGPPNSAWPHMGTKSSASSSRRFFPGTGRPVTARREALPSPSPAGRLFR